MRKHACRDVEVVRDARYAPGRDARAADDHGDGVRLAASRDLPVVLVVAAVVRDDADEPVLLREGPARGNRVEARANAGIGGCERGAVAGRVGIVVAGVPGVVDVVEEEKRRVRRVGRGEARGDGGGVPGVRAKQELHALRGGEVRVRLPRVGEERGRARLGVHDALEPGRLRGEHAALELGVRNEPVRRRRVARGDGDVVGRGRRRGAGRDLPGERPGGPVTRLPLPGAEALEVRHLAGLHGVGAHTVHHDDKRHRALVRKGGKSRARRDGCSHGKGKIFFIHVEYYTTSGLDSRRVFWFTYRPHDNRPAARDL